MDNGGQPARVTDDGGQRRAAAARVVIEPLLDPGERLLWCERPGRFYIPKMAREHFRIELWVLAPIVLIAVFVRHTPVGSIVFDQGWPVFAGLVMMRILMAALVNIDMSYGLSERRLYAVRARPWRLKKQLSVVNLEVTGYMCNADASGDILIGKIDTSALIPAREQRQLTPFFEAIDNVKEVYELMLAAQRIAQPGRAFQQSTKDGLVVWVPVQTDEALSRKSRRSKR